MNPEPFNHLTPKPIRTQRRVAWPRPPPTHPRCPRAVWRVPVWWPGWSWPRLACLSYPAGLGRARLRPVERAELAHAEGSVRRQPHIAAATAA